MKKRILFIMMSLYNGGAERSLVNLLQELNPHKYDVDLILIKKEGVFIRELPTNVNLIDTPESFKMFYSKYSLGVKNTVVLLYKIFATAISYITSKNIVEMRLKRWNIFYDKYIKCISNEYDLAVGYISGETGYFLKKVNAKRKIMWVHNDYREAKYLPKYDYPHFEKVDEIVTISESCKQILLEEFPEFSQKIHCIPNITSAVILKKKAKEFYPEEYKSVQSPILVSIGRLNEQKGFDIAIKAAEILNDENIDFQWFILGNGELYSELKKLIEKCGVGNKVHLLGARENPYPYISNAQVLIQSSRYEGKSVVLDESKILGTPILATNYNTVKDQLKNGVEGIIVDMSPRNVAEGIKNILKDGSELEKIRKILSENKYDNAEQIALYEKIFDK